MVEFIGFLISLISILFLFFKGQHDLRQRRKNPPNYEEDEEEEEGLPADDPIRVMLKTLEMEDIPPPAPPPVQKKVQVQTVQQEPISKRQLRSKLEEHKLKSKLESRRLASELEKRKVHPTMGTHDLFHDIERKPARATELVQQLSGLREMILIHEILSPPVALRSSNERH